MECGITSLGIDRINKSLQNSPSNRSIIGRPSFSQNASFLNTSCFAGEHAGKLSPVASPVPVLDLTR